MDVCVGDEGLFIAVDWADKMKDWVDKFSVVVKRYVDENDLSVLLMNRLAPVTEAR